ncbi:MAG: RecX family transcriptional regulator [Clostridia bacterium]|nr:RecX family transcriptional regulator [Clostridia bacterium]
MIYSLDEFEKYDKMKSKVIKYVLYKKRTEQEIRQKFAKEFDENVLDDIIEELKEDKYINDYNYIERAVNEFVNLKSLSIKEIKYKLYSKGIKSNLIDEYIANNIDYLEEYEQKSASKIINKKRKSMEEEDIKIYLLKKGYQEDSIRNAFKEE